MKLRKATENKKPHRSLERLGTDDLKRVTGGHGFQWELAPGHASTFQMFDML
jgi:hypothetical protein